MFPALAQRQFRTYFTGQAISLIGTWTQQAALSWIAYRLTGSTIFLGFMVLAGQIPFVLLAPLGGMVADKFSHKRVLYTIQAVEMLVATTLAATAYWHGLTPAVLLVAAVILGICAAVEAPVRGAFLPELVPDGSKLPGALALYSMTANSARLIGPAVAGTLLVAGDPICFAINALSCLLPFYTLSRVRVAEHHGSPNGSRFTDGVRFVWQAAAVREGLLMVIAMGLATSAFITLLPAYAKDVLHGGSQTYGWLMASSGFGSVCSWAFFASKYGHKLGPGSIGTGLVVQALAAAAFAGTTSVATGMATIFVFSIASALISSPVLVACHHLAPRELRGRIMAIYGLALMGSWPFGAIAFGYVAAHFGMATSFYWAAIIEVLAAAYFMARVRPRLAVAMALPAASVAAR